MRNSFASSVFLRGMVAGREMTKAVAPMAICMIPRGLTHRTSPTTSGVERSPEVSSSAKRSPLEENARERPLRRLLLFFSWVASFYALFVFLF